VVVGVVVVGVVVVGVVVVGVVVVGVVVVGVVVVVVGVVVLWVGVVAGQSGQRFLVMILNFAIPPIFWQDNAEVVQPSAVVLLMMTDPTG